MRVRTARWFHREEVKRDRPILHPQVVRQLDEADAQEEIVMKLQDNCRACGSVLEETDVRLCADCVAIDDMYGTCDVCGEPIDYCLGGHFFEYEED